VRSVPISFSIFFLHHTFPMCCSGHDLPLLCLFKIASTVHGCQPRMSLVVAVLGPSAVEPWIFTLIMTMSVPGLRHREQEYGYLSNYHRRPRSRRGRHHHRTARHTWARHTLRFFQPRARRQLFRRSSPHPSFSLYLCSVPRAGR
jgi:hypothetical protein